ncbi:uncharacterized protein [Physcomitrium patens]|uniref:Uncharacterized protein n=1 Tax=Physcomitrium patens TaxID=3218 RepID=A0A7I4CCG3_PHYPA
MVELDFTALHFSAGTRSHHFCRFMMWGSSHSRTDGSGAGIHLSFLHRLGLWCGTNGSTEHFLCKATASVSALRSAR